MPDRKVSDMFDKMDLGYGLVLVDEDCVIVRATDGMAVRSDGCGDGYFIGHVVSAIPYHVEWDDDGIVYSTDEELAAAIHDDGSKVWRLAPRSFDTYHIGDMGDYDFVIA